MKMKNKRVFVLGVTLLVMVTTIPMQVGAAETKWNMGSVVNTGKDNGYSGKESIKSDDPHYGWTLGQFYVQGYSGRQEDESGNVALRDGIPMSAGGLMHLKDMIETSPDECGGFIPYGCKIDEGIIEVY